MNINWYPGHMAKTKKQLREQISNVDFVVEICDARLPYSSRNPDLIGMIGTRKHILLMNKSDLADSSVSDAWINHFRKSGIDVRLVNSKMLSPKDQISMMNGIANDILAKAANKGVKKTLRGMVVGVPNVGKSTYINRLHGSSVATTGDKPGVTKNTQWIRITPYLSLMDTPGMLWPRLDDQLAARRLCYIGSVSDSVVDLTELSVSLLEDIASVKPEMLKERFHIDDCTLKGTELLDAVCRGRGFLMKGGIMDYERCQSVILDEFRSGKLGRISLEKPSIMKEDTYDGQ